LPNTCRQNARVVNIDVEKVLPIIKGVDVQNIVLRMKDEAGTSGTIKTLELDL